MNAILPEIATKPAPTRRRIAVVGSGISGLAAAWLLGERHEVTVYERTGWIGGHSHTVDVMGPDGPIAVDTGFIVYNEPNYPNLTALFRHLGVATQAAPMSFSASMDAGAFEYASSGINQLLGQRGNLVRPRFWRMARDILRFYAEARSLAAGSSIPAVSLGEHLAASGYSVALRDDHVIPMCASIWSTSPGKILDMPLAAFVRFFSNHGLLEIGRRPNWRTVTGGSRSYVDRLLASRRFSVHSGGAASIVRTGVGVGVIDTDGTPRAYDEVVIATHADTALSLLDQPTAAERHILGSFRYTRNLAVLHRDAALMPRRRRVWSSWNFLGSRELVEGAPLSVTYWMNKLQSLDPRLDLFVTLNAHRPIREQLIEGQFEYEHPVFDQSTLEAQSRLWSLQGQGGVWFCGAHFGHGFHEDGLQSGLAVAEQLGGVVRPWIAENPSGRIAVAGWSIERAA